MSTSTLLAVIGSNPSTTSGIRTRNRAQKACLLLGFDGFIISNLVDVPTYRTGDISDVAGDYNLWLRSRANLAETLSKASGVLVAYGLTKPSGLAGKHHAKQVEWLNHEINKKGLPVWAVGGKPRHPSRWQRFTYRTHPGIDFDTALALSLKQTEVNF